MKPTPKLPRQTKTERLYFERFIKSLDHFKYEQNVDYALQNLIPKEWWMLENDIDVTEKKVKVTLLLDESVAKFYRAMGQGYQARINRILATYAQMRIAKVEDLWRYMKAGGNGGTVPERASDWLEPDRAVYKDTDDAEDGKDPGDTSPKPFDAGEAPDPFDGAS
jgi:uncharacterized protein (DUF4415 family)